ncbi:MAG: hypothetical protein VX438_06180, partial [Planctomycetota bacterium]|nr:hypothetical protein [Planctomycetota bacterium]
MRLFANTTSRILIATVACLYILFPSERPIHAKQDFPEGEKLFALQIKRLFADKCMACHGAD